MIKIEEFIQLALTKRQAHLRLSDACEERGNNCSVEFKGLLAYILNTTIPSGYGIHLCHACNNEKCSNPYHLYWGTAVENRADSITSGRNNKSAWQYSVEKHGLEKAKELARNNAKNFCMGG